MSTVSLSYRFRTSKIFKSLTFPTSSLVALNERGDTHLGVRLFDFKRKVVTDKGMGNSIEFEFKVVNADTDEEYTLDTHPLPPNTQLIVSRLPATKGTGLLSRIKRFESTGGKLDLNSKSADENTGGTLFGRSDESEVFEDIPEERVISQQDMQIKAKEEEIKALQSVTSLATSYRHGLAPNASKIWMAASSAGRDEDADSLGKSTTIGNGGMAVDKTQVVLPSVQAPANALSNGMMKDGTTVAGVGGVGMKPKFEGRDWVDRGPKKALEEEGEKKLAGIPRTFLKFDMIGSNKKKDDNLKYTSGNSKEFEDIAWTGEESSESYLDSENMSINPIMLSSVLKKTGGMRSERQNATSSGNNGVIEGGLEGWVPLLSQPILTQLSHINKTLPEHLTCPLCKSLLRSPVILNWDDEGRTTCRVCVENALKTEGMRGVCPVSGVGGVSFEDVIVNKGLDKAALSFLSQLTTEITQIDAASKTRLLAAHAASEALIRASEFHDESSVTVGEASSSTSSSISALSRKRRVDERRDKEGGGGGEEDEFGGDVFDVNDNDNDAMAYEDNCGNGNENVNDNGRGNNEDDGSVKTAVRPATTVDTFALQRAANAPAKAFGVATTNNNMQMNYGNNNNNSMAPGAVAPAINPNVNKAQMMMHSNNMSEPNKRPRFDMQGMPPNQNQNQFNNNNNQMQFNNQGFNNNMNQNQFNNNHNFNNNRNFNNNNMNQNQAMYNPQFYNNNNNNNMNQNNMNNNFNNNNMNHQQRFNPQQPMVCYKCNEPGHLARDCPTLGNGPSVCFKCGLGGHIARTCTNPPMATPAVGSSAVVAPGVSASAGKSTGDDATSTSTTASATASTPGMNVVRKDVNTSMCFKCNQTGHFARDCPNNIQVSPTARFGHGQQGQGQGQGQGPTASGGVCYKCNKPGHFARDCREGAGMNNNNNNSNNNNGGGQNQEQGQGQQKQVGLCYKCNKPGHFARDCPTNQGNNNNNNQGNINQGNRNNHEGNKQQQQQRSQPETTNTGGNLCYKCNKPGHFARDCIVVIGGGGGGGGGGGNQGQQGGGKGGGQGGGQGPGQGQAQEKEKASE